MLATRTAGVDLHRVEMTVAIDDRMMTIGRRDAVATAVIGTAEGELLRWWTSGTALPCRLARPTAVTATTNHSPLVDGVTAATATTGPFPLADAAIAETAMIVRKFPLQPADAATAETAIPLGETMTLERRCLLAHLPQ